MYGEALSSYLPIIFFEWMTNEEICQFDVNKVGDDDSIGYILEVNLDYPNHLHDVHSDFPFCPETREMKDGVKD